MRLLFARIAYHEDIAPPSPSRLAIVLIDIRNPLNIGAAARAMANFGVNDLRLVNPWEPSFREAVSAVGGAHVLQTARLFSSVAEAVADCSLVVGTTAGTRRIAQQPLETLDVAVEQIQQHSGRAGILFGSEKFGLSNDDLSYCHLLARIPTLPETPSMNLGQAVAVCLYEAVRERHSREVGVPSNQSEPVDGAEAEQITNMILEVLDESGYTNRITAVSTVRKIRRWIRRTRLSRRDGPLLLGILRQILWKFKKE